MVKMANRKSRLFELLNGDSPDTSVRGRFLKGLGRLLGKGVILKRDRSKNPSFVMDPIPRMRAPRYNFPALWENWQHSWALQSVGRAITQEIMRNGWEGTSKFKLKCTKCNEEYDETVEECICGSTNLRKPDTTQLDELNKILQEPNPDYSFSDLLYSIINYDLGLGNWYLSIAPKEYKGLKKPAEIYVEDARFIIPVADVYGHLGSYQYFCPKCWERRIEEFSIGMLQLADVDTYVDIRTLPENQRENPKCPKCGYSMIETAYVQQVAGEIQTRWGVEEIIHGSMTRVLPNLHGVSKLVVLWKVVETLQSMDDYNWEVYGTGKTGAIIQMPGYDEQEVTEIKTRIEQELQGIGNRDVQTGRARLSKRIRTVFLGGKRDQEPLRRTEVMSSLSDMQGINFYMLYWQAIMSVYGVQAIFVTFSEKGKTGTTPVLQIRVQDRTTKDYQRHIEDVFNSKVLPKFGITDWIFKFKELEKRDELREAQIKQTNAAAALTWVRGGFNVSITEKGELEVTGEGQMPEQRTRVGEPRREEDGAPTGVESVRPEAETRESDRTGELVQR